MCTPCGSCCVWVPSICGRGSRWLLVGFAFTACVFRISQWVSKNLVNDWFSFLLVAFTGIESDFLACRPYSFVGICASVCVSFLKFHDCMDFQTSCAEFLHA